MAFLIDTNPYLRDPQERRRFLERNAYDSSVYEGARGLTPPPVQPPVASRSRPSASKKKSPKAS